MDMNVRKGGGAALPPLHSATKFASEHWEHWVPDRGCVVFTYAAFFVGDPGTPLRRGPSSATRPPSPVVPSATQLPGSAETLRREDS